MKFTMIYILNNKTQVSEELKIGEVVKLHYTVFSGGLCSLCKKSKQNSKYEQTQNTRFRSFRL